LLTVYSLRGLALPDDVAVGRGQSRDIDERLSMCVLYLAAWLTQRGMYFGDVHSRKGIAIDEAWALSTFSTGRRFIETASRDSRKHNTRVLLASQNPADLLALGLANLVSTAFVGRLTDADAQRDALAFLPDVAAGQGYEAIIGSLSAHAAVQGHTPDSTIRRRGAREFVFSDGAGGVERIRLELDSLPAVLDALDTTADPERSRARLDHSRTSIVDSAPSHVDAGPDGVVEAERRVLDIDAAARHNQDDLYEQLPDALPDALPEAPADAFEDDVPARAAAG
jgi:hypothetical protein